MIQGTNGSTRFDEDSRLPMSNNKEGIGPIDEVDSHFYDSRTNLEYVYTFLLQRCR